MSQQQPHCRRTAFAGQLIPLQGTATARSRGGMQGVDAMCSVGDTVLAVFNLVTELSFFPLPVLCHSFPYSCRVQCWGPCSTAPAPGVQIVWVLVDGLRPTSLLPHKQNAIS